MQPWTHLLSIMPLDKFLGWTIWGVLIFLKHCVCHTKYLVIFTHPKIAWSSYEWFCKYILKLLFLGVHVPMYIRQTTHYRRANERPRPQVWRKRSFFVVLFPSFSSRTFCLSCWVRIFYIPHRAVPNSFGEW